MAVEARRGCGYRKVGGLYIVGGVLHDACCKLPIALHICPTCSQGVKQTRGWSWIDPRPWLQQPCSLHRFCPAASPAQMGERVGLLWIGRAFYPTPGAFLHEAAIHGVSRRIAAVPRGFKVGEHWVFLAHPEAVITETGKTPGIFSIFKPTAIEKIVTQTQATDADAMAELMARGITPIAVPDDDKDHQGTVYDEAEDTELNLDLKPEEVEAIRRDWERPASTQPIAEDDHAR